MSVLGLSSVAVGPANAADIPWQAAASGECVNGSGEITVSFQNPNVGLLRRYRVSGVPAAVSGPFVEVPGGSSHSRTFSGLDDGSYLLIVIVEYKAAIFRSAVPQVPPQSEWIDDGSQQFRIVIECEEPPTTTAAPTTTEAPTTTAAPTTTVPATTTTGVGGGAGTAPSTTAAGGLPSVGADSTNVAWLASLFVLAGAGMLLVRMRPRRS
jgi:hypothetical protein